jgi:hypothetical protein
VAQTVTFIDMQTLLSTLLDDSNASGLWDGDARKRALNNSYFDLYNMGVSLSDGQGPEVVTGTVTVTAETATAALPADFYRMVSLYYTESSTSTFKMIPIAPSDQHEWRRTTPRSAKQLAFYFRSSSIVLVPTPDWSGTLTIEYVPEPTELDLNADVPLLPKTHRELIVYGALIRLKEKEGVEPNGTSIAIHQGLKASFERDMETRQFQSSRRLAGNSGYGIYESRV